MTAVSDIKIIHSDNHIVVVKKPGGMLAVPGRGKDKQDCVTYRVKQSFPSCIDQPAVHRLDMFTSGLMVLAMTADAHRHLSKQFEARTVTKHYIALLDGLLESKSGRIELAFRLDQDNRPYQVYDPVQGKVGISTWKTIQIEENRTRVLFIPFTGRTHQLRLHASHERGLNCPIIGDRLYGTGKEGDRMYLHASYLQFQHPQSSETISFESEAPF